MSEVWIHKYILLAFRINRLVERIYGSPFIEDYYGPHIWKEQVENEAEVDAPDLVRQAISLSEVLPIQGFPERRSIYLGKQLKAMETRQLIISAIITQISILTLKLQPVSFLACSITKSAMRGIQVTIQNIPSKTENLSVNGNTWNRLCA